MTPLKPKKGSKTKWTSEKTKIKDYVQRKNKGIRKTSKKRWTFISSLSLGWGTKKVQIKINKNKKILVHQSPAKCCPLSCSCYVTLLFFFSPKISKDKTKPQTSIQYLFLLSNTQNLTSVPKGKRTEVLRGCVSLFTLTGSRGSWARQSLVMFIFVKYLV